MGSQIFNTPLKISVIIPVYNASDMLNQCLSAVASSDYPYYECLIVDDGSIDDSPQIVREFGFQVINIPDGPLGPAHARNKGVKEAQGEIVFFIDSDVVIQPDTIKKVAQSFIDHPEYDALFGSYDDEPGDSQFLSIFKNLTHHYVHQQANPEGHTFWTGCGAIRRDVFLKMGGFDTQRYPRPSIEDIELGVRLSAEGHRILVNNDIQVKHTKRWTLLKLVKTDVFDRGIPWTLLILQERNLPNDLNLNHTQRLSVLFLMLILVDLSLSVFVANQIILLPALAFLFLAIISSWQLFGGPKMYLMGRKFEILSYSMMVMVAILALILRQYLLLLPLALILLVLITSKLFPSKSLYVRNAVFGLVVISFAIGFVLLVVSFPLITALPIILGITLILWLNRDYYLFLARTQGPFFAIAALPFQLFYFLYSLIAFFAGYVMHLKNIWLMVYQKYANSG